MEMSIIMAVLSSRSILNRLVQTHIKFTLTGSCPGPKNVDVTSFTVSVFEVAHDLAPAF